MKHAKKHVIAVKKKHTVKNTVITTENKVVIFASSTDNSNMHDIAQLRENFEANLNWFEDLEVLVDLGYMSFKKEYPGCSEVLCPIRRLPRRGKNLHKTEEELLPQSAKDHNKFVSQNRVWVEHAIGGIKRFFCLRTPWRNHIQEFQDHAFRIAAGIWNLHLGVRFIY